MEVQGTDEGPVGRARPTEVRAEARPAGATASGTNKDTRRIVTRRVPPRSTPARTHLYVCAPTSAKAASLTDELVPTSLARQLTAGTASRGTPRPLSALRLAAQFRRIERLLTTPGPTPPPITLFALGAAIPSCLRLSQRLTSSYPSVTLALSLDTITITDDVVTIKRGGKATGSKRGRDEGGVSHGEEQRRVTRLVVVVTSPGPAHVQTQEKVREKGSGFDEGVVKRRPMADLAKGKYALTK
mmetsp:Transcript_15013/g.46981  ORF Transcript_15013/g.46981 Transcript_15013/m.46981 type:complete len:243 (-) Transcript_15013:143-871(-)